MAKKIELLHTTYDESGNIESQEVVHPLTSPDCIIMENGKTLDEVMGDGIATPTLTHEGTSFKVGVGDSNIEVVDGDVAGMTLKGQSYQNILPKPTTLIMETDEKEFKINDKIDSNIIIDDNIAEIATVKGKTIVNTVQEESGSEYTVLGENLSGQSIVTTNKPEGNIKGVTLQGQTLVNVIQEPCEDEYVVLDAEDGNLAYDTIIKPSTLYTVRFKHDTVNADNPLTVDLGGTVQTVTSTEFTITTPTELTHNQLVFSGKNNVVSEVQVIEGDVTNIEYPFFEGMSDVKEVSMKVTGKNLMYIPSDLQVIGGHQSTTTLSYSNGIITLTGKTTVEDDTERYVSTNAYVYLEGGKTYTISFESDAKTSGTNGTDTVEIFLAWENKYVRDENGLMEFYEINAKTKTIKPNLTGKYYLRLDLNKASGTTHSFYNIQVEEGSIVTPYEPYHEVIVQQDIDSIPLTSDMFEQGNIASGKIIGMSYQQLSHNTETIRVKSKTLIPIKPNGKYIIQNLNKTNNRLWGWQYDKNGGYLSSIGNTDEIDMFQFDSKAHYITFVLCNQNDSAISPSDLDSMNLILQEVPQEIVLRGIGDVKDELDLTRGEYIQRIKEFVLDGSENWAECTEQHGENTMLFQCREVGCSTISNQTTDGFMCSQLKSVAASPQWINDEQCISLNVSNAIGIRISKTNATNKNEFLSWLQKEPITIQCRLNIPIIHKVNLTNTKVIPSYATETHYETVTPSDSLIPNITIPSTLNYDVAIKPSTEYTIRANTSDNLTVDLGGTTGTLSNGKVTLTTPGTLTHNEVKFSGTGKVKELMVVEDNEIKDNVPFFNGMKNVQMGGIKLVNIARGMTLIGADTLSINTNKTQITYNGVVNAFRAVKFDGTLLKPNTVYTIYLNITENTSTLTNPIKFLYDNDDAFIDFGGTGIKKVAVTTPNVLRGRIELAFRPCTTSQKIVVQNPMIIEGDWTHLDEIPYIESEMIIEQPIIRSQGKNLLDLESKPFTVASTGTTFTKNGSTYTVTTTLANSTPYDYIRRVWTVNNDKWLGDVAGKKLTLSVSSISCTNSNSMACIQLRIECMDGTKYYPGIHNGGKTVTFNMPINVKDLQMQVMTNNTGTKLTEDAVLTISNIQLELGDTATSYKAYRHQTLYSNRVIGYEDGCYYTWDVGTKMSSGAIASVISDVEGLNVAYVTHASSNFSFYDKDGVYLSGSMYLSTATDSKTDNNFDKFGFIKIPENAKYMKMACGNTNSAAAKDYHLKATVTGELPLRSLPNGVCDTLNLVTGEYVQNIKEVVIDGSEDWFIQEDNTKTEKTIYCRCISFPDNLPLPSDWDNNAYNVNLNCDNLTVYSSDYMWKNEVEGISRVQSSRYLRIRLNKNKLDTPDLAGFKQYLSQNPITVQYQLEIPIVRKLGFTTKGNYREQVLDGSETWAMDAIDNSITVRMTKKTTSPLQNPLYNTPLFTDDYHVRAGGENHSTYEYITCIGNGIYINIYQTKVNELSIQGCTQWLSQNPIKVGYITSTQSSESYSNIHKPIFFNNVDVQFLPNNVDIQPELTYQVRTRNSYVMDMMKANTKYSVKLLLNTGEFVPTIDGVNNPLVNGRTFTSPSALTNKLLITPCIKELMIIEGDVTGKNLPYFKGILSSYHDVDEIELYSVNKNLFDMSKVKPFEGRGTYWWNTIVKENEVVSVRIGDINNGQFGAYIKLDVRPNSVYTLYIEMEKDGEPYNGQIYGYENDDLWGNGTFTGYANTRYHISTSQNAKYITIGFNYGKDFPIGTTLVSKNMRLYLGEESPVYIPHAHSTTLIEMPTRLETVKVVRPIMENGAINTGTGASYDDGDALVRNVRTKDYLPVQPGEIIKFYNNGQGRAVNIHYYDINKQFIKYEFYDGTSTRPTVPKDCYFVRMYCGKSACSDITLTRQAYKPIQLNSLPNGVCDEIIMKPNSNKAQLVQRVGKVVLDGSEDWYQSKEYTDKYKSMVCYIRPSDVGANCYTITDKYVTRTSRAEDTVFNYFYVGSGNVNIVERPNVHFEEVKTMLQQNPIIVYYELATPIVHEIQLKGYPHVYENGTVTLNTDIPHKTLVSYNVNQEQLINTQNETIIRHDQQIDDLYYYIEMYLEEIYQMELFRMKLELSL